MPPSSDLLRRLNPKYTQRNLDYIIRLAPDLTEDLLSSVDQPLVVKRCKQSGRDYLLCDYNRDGDSYRSPWSNQFDPPLDEAGPGGVGAGGNDGAGEGAVPGERVRKMEIKANEAFDIYRELYYEGGVSSVYLWNLDDGFAGVVLLKKCESPPHVLSRGLAGLMERGGIGYKRERLSLISALSPRKPGVSPCIYDRPQKLN